MYTYPLADIASITLATILLLREMKFLREKEREEAQAAYDKAKAAYDGTSPQPLTLLGTQVVAGTNYAFLAKGKTETDNPRSAIQVVIVYEDLEGNAEITNICTLDLGEFDE